MRYRNTENGKKNRDKIKFIEFRIIKVQLLFIFLLLWSDFLKAQMYPEWFLNTDIISCQTSSVGLAARSYYKDTTAIKRATSDAIDNFFMQQNLSLDGSQGYWSTEMGNAWMGNDFIMKIDSSEYNMIKETTSILDTFINSNLVMVLCGQKECIPNRISKHTVLIDTLNRPRWTEIIPKSTDYYYAIGVAPVYLYEFHSWESAQKNAILNLAREIQTSIKSLQIKSDVMQEIK